MPTEIPDDLRDEAVASLQTWVRDNLDESIGNIMAGALLDFVLEEIGPIVYNRAVIDVQKRLQVRLMELDVELHRDELPHWRRTRR